MTKFYAISDPHGCLDVFQNALSAIDLLSNNHLFLLGDYIPHQTPNMDDDEYFDRSIEALMFVRELKQAHRASITVLMGNHEYDFLDRFRYENTNAKVIRRINLMVLHAETNNQIFVHAGIRESTNWKVETSRIDFLSRGCQLHTRFDKDIIAGHRSASGLAKDPNFEGVFWDGLSHYVIDGETERTGIIPILVYDTDTQAYTQMIATNTDVSEPKPIKPGR